MSKRFDWLDISKGIAIFLVIIGHTLPYESTLRHAIFSFHMPLFFIAAGFTFKIKPWRELISSSVERLLLPYVLIFFLCQGIYFFTSNVSVNADSFIALLMQFVFASGTGVEPFGFSAVGMTWFLVALFCSRLLFNGVLILFKRFSLNKVVQGGLLLVLAAGAAFIGGKLRFYLPFDLDICLFVLFYMWVGLLFKQINITNILVKTPYFILAIVAWVVCTHFSYFELAARRYDGFVFGFIAAIAGSYIVFAFSYLLERFKTNKFVYPIENFLVFCGKNSMGIYAIHATDWWIPWAALPLLLSHNPLIVLWGGIVLRCLYCLFFMLLMKKA